jgi:hypothetical protein
VCVCHCGLTCIILIINGIKHLFMYILAI